MQVREHFVDHGCGVEWRMRKTIIVSISFFRTKYGTQLCSERKVGTRLRPHFFLLAINSILRRIPTNLVRRIYEDSILKIYNCLFFVARTIMAERPTQFSYHNIQLYKSESLGSGSYGGVCKAQCDGLLCAAKIMHPTLFDLRDPGTGSYLRKFREECHLLSLARHPNVVQYLGTYTDPDTRLPVLLMELCDESLTGFLERSPGPLSYHIQVNICHDIALALVYLHSNGLIHRDLTGNNVLMIAGIRAKITDFGMSKLATVNPRMTALTLCPGNVLYMSPEALDEAKSYTAKLDIFSFGVIVIQILTRQFPNPTDRFRHVSVAEFEEQVRVYSCSRFRAS